jgi:hypothetical protein
VYTKYASLREFLLSMLISCNISQNEAAAIRKVIEDEDIAFYQNINKLAHKRKYGAAAPTVVYQYRLYLRTGQFILSFTCR